jgi:signal transduction histidine kinase
VIPTATLDERGFMSSTTMGAAGTHRSKSRLGESGRFRALSLAVTGGSLLVVVAGLRGQDLASLGWTPFIWGGLVVLASFVAIPTGDGASLSMDLPLLLGAAVVFHPAVCGLIAIVGASDPREWRLRVSGWLAIYNRSQVALSVMAASVTFHALGGRVGMWPWAAIASLLALSVDCVVNYSFVAIAVSIRQSSTFRRSIRTLRFGEPRVFVPTYVSFGFLGALLAETYASVGLAGVVAFVAPILLARQVFAHWRELERFARSLSVRTRALEDVDRKILEERRDERLVLAGDIHDEVLPPLFKVHLMGEVLRRDLESGRLLDLDEDLPQLLHATRTAQDAIRRVLKNLRASSMGPEGLNSTLRLLAKSVEGDTDAEIQVDLDDVRGSSANQLLIYQIAREVLHNAAKHSQAARIHMSLTREGDTARLVVADNGVGFNPTAVDRDLHFGLQLLAERAEAAGGILHVTSGPGLGTTIVAVLPTDPTA